MSVLLYSKEWHTQHDVVCDWNKVHSISAFELYTLSAQFHPSKITPCQTKSNVVEHEQGANGFEATIVADIEAGVAGVSSMCKITDKLLSSMALLGW